MITLVPAWALWCTRWTCSRACTCSRTRSRTWRSSSRGTGSHSSNPLSSACLKKTRSYYYYLTKVSTQWGWFYFLRQITIVFTITYFRFSLLLTFTSSWTYLYIHTHTYIHTYILIHTYTPGLKHVVNLLIHTYSYLHIYIVIESCTVLLNDPVRLVRISLWTKLLIYVQDLNILFYKFGFYCFL
jgi:hypothetical protein